VDKPLSQERLSYNKLYNLDSLMIMHLPKDEYDKWLEALGEIRRLQAIEQALQEFGLHNGTAQDVFDWLESTTGYKGAE
jgi:hypothetical protein